MSQQRSNAHRSDRLAYRTDGSHLNRGSQRNAHAPAVYSTTAGTSSFNTPFDVYDVPGNPQSTNTRRQPIGDSRDGYYRLSGENANRNVHAYPREYGQGGARHPGGYALGYSTPGQGFGGLSTLDTLVPAASTSSHHGSSQTFRDSRNGGGGYHDGSFGRETLSPPMTVGRVAERFSRDGAIDGYRALSYARSPEHLRHATTEPDLTDSVDRLHLHNGHSSRTRRGY